MTTRALVVAAAAVLLLAGCSAPAGTPTAAQTGAASSDPLRGTVTVLAAASLTEVYGELATRFEKLHPGVTVTESFGGSSALAAQIVQGAPVDVFASANEATMTTVTDAGLADGAPVTFATNVLTLVVPPGNPAHVSALADLARPEVKVALCDPAVPCGSAAAGLLTAEKLKVTPVTLETDVKAVLTKVELDEVDAGLVYVTDARSAGSKVTQIAVADPANPVNRYPIVVLSGSANKAAARAFESFVLSATGRAALEKAGFGAP